MRLVKPASRWRGPTSVRKVVFGLIAEMTMRGVQLLAARQAHAGGAVVLDQDLCHRRHWCGWSRPAAAAAFAIAAATAAMPPVGKASAAFWPAASPDRRLSSRISELGERGPSQAPKRGVEPQQALQAVVGQFVVQHIGDVDQEHPQEFAEIGLAQARARQGQAWPAADSRCPRPWPDAAGSSA